MNKSKKRNEILHTKGNLKHNLTITHTEYILFIIVYIIVIKNLKFKFLFNIKISRTNCS